MVKERYGMHSQNKGEVFPGKISSLMIRAFSEFKRKALKILTKTATEYLSCS